ncbi:alcohol dehydrogenase [Methylobacterium sp. Leaf123]|uniref:NAD(P)-dependent alcohol dehydrogenase n=1 Tax=Methylobacterium sp. Leaf123 TaxID=1736264 RepID=UPI0006FC2E60|nr:NAD(P)-dependent alcohol dehydrogenase [Methylobacterium sp. Leaf123]KQQ27093.1 alcohol dehydrogenase [Methylobacterium sp. Leaf123]
MKRVQYDRYGGPEVMAIAECDLPPLRDDEVRVATRAAAINPFDWKLRRGAMRLVTGRRFPRAMGTDFAGIVEATGAAVRHVQAGDAVFGSIDFKKSGAFAETIIVNAAHLAAKPSRLSFGEAASLPIAAMTAWVALLDKAQVGAGTRILIHGCAGAVGAFASQLAVAHGAEVTGTCGPDSIDTARAAGVTSILAYSDVKAAIPGARFDAVFDTIGTLDAGVGLAMLAPKGVFIDINPTPARMLRGFLSRRYRLAFANAGLKHLPAIARLAQEGALRPNVGREAPFSEALTAITEAETGPRRAGKTVLVF